MSSDDGPLRYFGRIKGVDWANRSITVRVLFSKEVVPQDNGEDTLTEAESLNYDYFFWPEELHLEPQSALEQLL